MAVPSISTYSISNGSHRYGSIGGAAVMTSPSDSVTKVSAIISQTSGGAAIETVETTVKTSSDQFADRWALSWPTTGITSSPYYVKMWATNADGNGPTREVAPYIYFPPTVAITAPANGSTLSSASVTMAWTASDPYGISAQRVTVLHGADVLLDESVSESATSYAVPSSVAFLDGESYTFRVTARNGNGMEASADSTCAFSFDAPAAASVTIADDGATATITVDDPHYSESGSTISVDGSAIADSFTVFGKSTQDGTPTPGAPVPIVSVADGGTLNVKTKDSANVTTVYPIDLQGNSLRSLPDGTRDELRVEGGNAVLVKRVGHIVLDGSETFYMTTSGYQTYFDHVDSTAPLVYGATTFDKRPYTMSNITTDARNPDNPNVSDASIWVYAFTSDTQGIRIRLGGGVISSQTSVAALQQWLAATNVEILYKLAAPQEIDLGAVSDHPFIPEDGEMWVDGTTMEASLRPADYAGQPTIQSVDIARVNPDGTWTLAQGVAEGQSAIDPLPPLGVAYRYALTSHAAGGGTKVAYVEHIVETRAWHLNFGNAAQEHVSYLYNPQATMTLAQGGESYHFADGGAGRGLPVFYPTTDRDMSGTLRFDTVLYGDSDILLDLCDRYPVAWLRDPFGHRWRAHVRPSVSHGTGQVWPVTIAWDAVRFEEV